MATDVHSQAIDGIGMDEWMAAYRAYKRGDTSYPPGAYCSLDAEDWRDAGQEAVYMPVPAIVLDEDAVPAVAREGEGCDE